MHELATCDANIGALNLLVQRERPLSARIDSPATQAHEAAEAIFKPKAEVISRPEAPTPPTAPPPARTPRILSVSTARTVPRKVETDQAQPAGLTIPGSEIPRIKTWLKYGMTVPQVARIYGVAVDDIKRALAQG